MAMRMDMDLWLTREIAQIADEFQGAFSQQTIDRYVHESITALEGSRVTDFIPIFVARFTRERLKALAQADGLITKDRPEVLFVCVHNAGRSQMAAALAHQLSGGRVSVRSAGSAPASEINRAVMDVMGEIGIDLSQEFPKPLTDEVVRAADAVITMGCGDACPLYPGKRYEDWPIDDPSGQPIETVRAIRDTIAVRVELLLAQLGIARSAQKD